MKSLNSTKNLFYSACAMAVTLGWSIEDALAQASGGTGSATVGTKLNGLRTEVKSAGEFLLIAAFLFGVFLVFTGILKLKQSNDDEGRTKASAGAIRIVLGGLGMALGLFSGVITSTLGFGGAPSFNSTPF